MAPYGGGDGDPYEPSGGGGNIFEDDTREFDTSDKISPFFQDIEDTEPDVLPLSLPADTWTLLPAIERCDNFKLPQGPFGPFWHKRAQADREAIRAERLAMQKRADRGDEMGVGSLNLNDRKDEEEEVLTPFFYCETDKKPVGFLRPAIVQALVRDNEKAVNKLKMEPCWRIHSYKKSPETDTSTRNTEASETSNSSSKSDKEPSHAAPSSDDEIWGISLSPSLRQEGKEAISEHFDRLTRGWKESGQFPEELKGWRGELYPVYGPEMDPNDPDFNPLPGANHVFDVERAACSLFGFATFGVHMTAYVRSKDFNYRIWVPKRAKTKQTWPGYLDNSVAGGITTGDSPLETLIRECAEEANLPPTFVRKHARPTGVISYIYRNKYGWIQPEVEYTYDLEMPAPPEAPTSQSSTATLAGHPNDAPSRAMSAPSALGDDGTASVRVDADGMADVNENGDPCILRPNDGEAESFALMHTDEILAAITANKFKANCALVLIDFFIRHGLITAETDAKYLDLNQRLKQSIYPLPGPA